MAWSDGLRERLVALFRKGKVERELDEELRFHVEQEIQQHVRAGVGAEEARRLALRDFGGIERTKEAVRDERGVRMIQDALADVRYALRGIGRQPGFAVAAVLTLALGIGANTAIFSVVSSVLLRPLPYPDSERIVRGWANEVDGIQDFSFRVVEYQALVDQAESFETVGADFAIDLTITGADMEPERVLAAMATPGYFDVFGAVPTIGRTFTREDIETGNQLVAVVTHGFWTRRFGADPGVVGQPVTLNGNPFTLLGVLPERFELVEGDAEVFIPYTVGTRGWIGRWLNVYGKLRPGASSEQAEAELSAIMARIGETEPRSADWSATFVPLREMVVGNVRPALLAIFATVVLVLLISCANVANLSLARTAQREREIVVRLALGAGRGRILRQVLVESVVLATAAGVAGVLIAFWGVQTLVALAPPDMPRLDGVGVDRGVLAFTLTISLLAGLAFGLAPALYAARSTAGGLLRQQTGKTTQDRQRNRILDGIVVSEIALALVLLISAGLVMKSFSRLLQVDTGFNQNNLLAIQLSPPASKYPLAEVPGFYERLSAQIGGLPGVRSVGLGSDLPLSGRAAVGGGISEASWRAGERETLPALQRKVNADFFAVIQTPLLSGRTFNSGDAEGPERLIINQTFARQLWGDEDPVGKRLTHTSNPSEDDWREVIGVVGDVLYEGMDREAYATYYQYQSFSPWRTMWIFVRTAGDSRTLIESARNTIRIFDADVPIYDVRTLTQVVGSSVASPRFNMWLFATFAAVALFLAAAGIYSVLSFVVTQRNREIGIRMALGAHQRSVIQLMMRRSLKLIVLGCGVGLSGALVSTRLLQHLLFEVSPTDPTTLAAVVTILVAAALAASYVPARRASLVDPMEVLREE